MAVIPRKTKAGIVFWVFHRQHGKGIWERVGTSRRDAERRDAAMKKEIKAGKYRRQMTGAITVDGFATEWLGKRNGRAAENDRNQYAIHVLGRCAWYAKMKVEDVRSLHTLELIDHLRLPYVGRQGTTRTLGEKTIALIVGNLSTMFRDARIRQLTPWDPCELPRGTLSRKVTSPRTPYEAAEAAMLMTDPKVDLDGRMWNALAFFTGMREGEVCGRRWHHLDRSPLPLWSLMVNSQYKDQPLKGDSRAKDRPRVVPVHPMLERMLDAWWREGFEFVYCRKPKLGDFIVPRRDANEENLTRSMAYKRFMANCKKVGVAAHTLHSTRNTFISLTRRGGARPDVLERITHNASGNIIDRYTTFDWQPLCDVVLCFPVVDVAAPAKSTRREKETEPA